MNVYLLEFFMNDLFCECLSSNDENYDLVWIFSVTILFITGSINKKQLKLSNKQIYYLFICKAKSVVVVEVLMI